MTDKKPLTQADIRMDDAREPVFKKAIMAFIEASIVQQTIKMETKKTPTNKPEDEAYKELYFTKEGWIILIQIFNEWNEFDIPLVQYLFEQKKLLMFMTKQENYDMRYNTKENVQAQLFLHRYTLKALEDVEKWCVSQGYIAHVNHVTPKMYRKYRDTHRLAYIAQQKANYEQLKQFFNQS